MGINTIGRRVAAQQVILNGEATDAINSVQLVVNARTRIASRMGVLVDDGINDTLARIGVRTRNAGGGTCQAYKAIGITADRIVGIEDTLAKRKGERQEASAIPVIRTA